MEMNQDALEKIWESVFAILAQSDLIGPIL